MLWMLLNAVWCQVYFLLDSNEAGEAYAACLNTAGDADARFACYLGLLEAVGNASLDYFSCMS
jgi:hypothetical protein